MTLASWKLTLLTPAPGDFGRLGQALGAEGGAEVHFGDFGEGLWAVFGDEFFGGGIYGGGGAFGEFRSELFFQGGQAGDEFVAG